MITYVILISCLSFVILSDLHFISYLFANFLIFKFDSKLTLFHFPSLLQKGIFGVREFVISFE